MIKPLIYFMAVALASFIGYVAGVCILWQLTTHFPGLGPFVFNESRGAATFNLQGVAHQPAVFMGVLAFCLFFEAACLGLDQSSLKRLLDGSSPSTRVDLFYTMLRLAGGFNVLVFLFSFGTLIWIVNRIHQVLHVAFLAHVHSFCIQLVIVLLINTFFAYWHHRFMHTRWMWELHKVHHAAEEMNVVTSFRIHPIEQVIMSITTAFPVAVMGAPPAVILTFTAINTVYNSLLHSEINFRWKLWNAVWMTPAAHRIHHSTRPEHFDTNFGIIKLWDWLFGTYCAPADEKLKYGVPDGETFNRPGHLVEIFDNVRRWLAPMFGGRELAVTEPKALSTGANDGNSGPPKRNAA